MSLTGRMGDDLENINQWVKEATEGKIENFLLELPQDTVLLLLNAIYFQGASLAQPYPPLTWKPAEAAPALFPALFYLCSQICSLLGPWLYSVLYSQGLSTSSYPGSEAGRA